MEDTVTTEADAAAMQAAQAGYANKRSALTGVAAPVISEPPAQPAEAPAPAADAPAVEAEAPAPEVETEAKEEPPAQQTAISQQLEDLKAQVRELKAGGADKQTIDRLFGEIGGITRVVKQLQQKVAPAGNELAGAIAAAEKAAEEYPEIGGPMLKALKALAQQIPQKPEEAEEVPQQPPQQSAAPYDADQLAFIKALDRLHPDRHELNKSPEFNQWLAAQGRDYEQMFRTSWDFAEIANGFTKFKQHKAAEAAKAASEAAAKARKQQERKDRLEAAHTPDGVGQAQPTVLPDDAGFARGYQRAKAKRHF